MGPETSFIGDGNSATPDPNTLDPRFRRKSLIILLEFILAIQATGFELALDAQSSVAPEWACPKWMEMALEKVTRYYSLGILSNVLEEHGVRSSILCLTSTPIV